MSATTLSVAAVLALATAPQCGGVQPDGEFAKEFAERLVAVATHESGRNPLAIGVNPEPSRGLPGASLRPTSAEEAVAAARALLQQGRRVDLGLMQISHVNLARHGLTLETVFGACANMRAGAAHLAADVRAVWNLAHRRYNCGGTGCGDGYAASVERTLTRLRGGAPEPNPPPPAGRSPVASRAAPPRPVNPLTADTTVSWGPSGG